MLEQSGYTVLAAVDGDEALAIAASHPQEIDLLITDVVIPGLSGPDLATRLAASLPGLRVIYTSGYADDAIVRHGVLGDGVAFLQKPQRAQRARWVDGHAS
jgi:two-component system, cell cycle sensor histidine kinase and response regulator CckA